jgi:hypothetical protein
MSKVQKAQRTSRQLEQLLFFVSKIPGLGFVEDYALKMRTANNQIDAHRTDIANKIDDIEDVGEAWDSFKDNAKNK